MKRIGLAIALAALLIPAAGSKASVAARTADLLPDLQMAPIYDVYLETTQRSRLLLRFGTLINNVGDGPLVIRGSVREDLELTRIVQRVWLRGGGYRKIVQPSAEMYFERLGDFDYWHLKNVVTMSLAPSPQTEPPTQRLSTKLGFCLVDTDQMPVEQRPPNWTSKTYNNCGTRTSKRVRMGISVGWGDTYKPYYKYQAIDITGLPSGNYRLCAIVNPQALWLEKSMADNVQWIDLTLDTTAKTVNQIGSGTTPCEANPTP